MELGGEEMKNKSTMLFQVLSMMKKSEAGSRYRMIGVGGILSKTVREDVWKEVIFKQRSKVRG